MAYIKKNELVVWRFKVAGKIAYVAMHETQGVNSARNVLHDALGDVFYVDTAQAVLITSLDELPKNDVSVNVFEGGKSQYNYCLPTVKEIVAAYVKRTTAPKIEEKKAPCDGEIVEIKGQKYKLSLVK
jgi:uncharacterized alkaline shock family protein YloU